MVKSCYNHVTIQYNHAKMEALSLSFLLTNTWLQMQTGAQGDGLMVRLLLAVIY